MRFPMLDWYLKLINVFSKEGGGGLSQSSVVRQVTKLKNRREGKEKKKKEKKEEGGGKKEYRLGADTAPNHLFGLCLLIIQSSDIVPTHQPIESPEQLPKINTYGLPQYIATVSFFFLMLIFFI